MGAERSPKANTVFARERSRWSLCALQAARGHTTGQVLLRAAGVGGGAAAGLHT